MCAGDIKFDANFVSVANEENGNVNDKKQVNSQKKSICSNLFSLLYVCKYSKSTDCDIINISMERAITSQSISHHQLNFKINIKTVSL